MNMKKVMNESVFDAEGISPGKIVALDAFTSFISGEFLLNNNKELIVYIDGTYRGIPGGFSFRMNDMAMPGFETYRVCFSPTDLEKMPMLTDTEIRSNYVVLASGVVNGDDEGLPVFVESINDIIGGRVAKATGHDVRSLVGALERSEIVSKSLANLAGIGGRQSRDALIHVRIPRPGAVKVSPGLEGRYLMSLTMPNAQVANCGVVVDRLSEEDQSYLGDVFATEAVAVRLSREFAESLVDIHAL